MTSRGQMGYRIALVDSDALQRICTSNSLTALGADCASFVHLAELVDALGEGQRFDAIIIGLHADASKTISRMPEVDAAAGRSLPLLYVAHRFELEIVRELPPKLLDQKPFRLLPTPVDDAALLDWLNTLDQWGEWPPDSGVRKSEA